MSLLIETRDAILKIVDPDRDNKAHPIRSPLYIKQKFFHAAVFGVPPLVDRSEFLEAYKGEESTFNSETKNRMCDTLQKHLDDEKPFLLPLKCEIMPDGTILARFAYKTVAEDDETAVLTLGKKLDPNGQFSRWDSSNLQRYRTVAAAICVIDKDKLSEQMPEIQKLLEEATAALIALGKVRLTNFIVIDDYDKRTISPKHMSVYRTIKPCHKSEINFSYLYNKGASYLPAFNRYTAVTALAVMAAIGGAVYMGSKDQEHNMPSPRL